MKDEQHRLVESAMFDADNLATCAEKLLAALNRKAAAIESCEVADMGDIGAQARADLELEQAEAEVSEYWSAVRRATYEYRNRAELARNSLTKTQQKYGPENPPRLRKPGESVEQYSAAMGWKSLTPEFVDLYARRYAYLRERDLNAIVEGGVFAGKVPDNVVLNGDDLDKAIDDAISLHVTRNDEK